jgi:hypothetical protein
VAADRSHRTRRRISSRAWGPTSKARMIWRRANCSLLARLSTGGGHAYVSVCSVGWWLIVGAVLFWEKSTVGWLLMANFFWEKSTAGWWLISQTNRASTTARVRGGAPVLVESTLQLCKRCVPSWLRICVALARRRCAQEVMQNALGLLACVATCVSRLRQLGDEWTHSVSSPRHDSRRQCNLYIFPQYL